jgi:hypothetical protein
MWVNSQPDDQGYINVSLGLFIGENEVTTTTQVKILPPKNGAVEVYNSTPSFNQEEELNCCAHIRSMLIRVNSANTKEEKATLTEEVLEYLRTTGLGFTKCNERFRNIVVKKCYELKICNPDLPDIVSKANQLLSALGETENIPDSIIQEFYCKGCEKYHSHSITHTSTSDARNRALPVTAAATRSEFYNADKTLFLTIAKRLNCPHIIENPDMYFEFYKKAEKDRLLKRNTVAERMEEYITGWSHGSNSNEGRAKTMKSIFAKYKLTYTDYVLPLYSEWLKTHIILLGRTNRYFKMMRFIELHKHLFSTA